MIRTFIDTGVLIAAARGQDLITKQAMSVLDDPNRVFISSIFLKLELLPKPMYHQKTAETAFYTAYFNAVTVWATAYQSIIELAYQGAQQVGLSAMDALHVSTASLMQADELVTTEKSNKPIHRTALVKVISIQPEPET